MNRRVIFLCIALAIALIAAGCAAAQPTAAPATATPATTQPAVTQSAAPTATPAITPAPEVTEPADEEPLPMKIDCAVPAGFTLDTDNSTATMSLYTSDVATIMLGYTEAADDTATPDAFKASILASLPKEQNADGFKLVSCEPANFDSYPGFIIKWTTGSNEDTRTHEAQFILTDGYNYRAEYAVSADSADDKAAEMKAFFNSIELKDAE